MKVNRITIPVDFTASSFQSIEIAAQIARKNKALLNLIYVVDVPYEGSKGTSDPMAGNVAGIGQSVNVFHDDEEEGAFYLHMLPDAQERLDKIKSMYPDVTFEEHVKPDSYERHLYTFITSAPADLIVQKASGNTDPSESKAADIIRYSPAPVLTLHGKHAQFNPTEIVFASDFKDVPENAVKFLKNIQADYDAKLHLLTVVTPSLFTHSKAGFQRMKAFIEENNFSNCQSHVFNASEVAEGIVDFSSVVGGDLLVMTTHGRTGIGHWVFGSAAESVAVYSSLPVITLNEHFNK